MNKAPRQGGSVCSSLWERCGGRVQNRVSCMNYGTGHRWNCTMDKVERRMRAQNSTLLLMHRLPPSSASWLGLYRPTSMHIQVLVQRREILKMKDCWSGGMYCNGVDVEKGWKGREKTEGFLVQSWTRTCQGKLSYGPMKVGVSNTSRRSLEAPKVGAVSYQQKGCYQTGGQM